jgi:hypothetical protein
MQGGDECTSAAVGFEAIDDAALLAMLDDKVRRARSWARDKPVRVPWKHSLLYVTGDSPSVIPVRTLWFWLGPCPENILSSHSQKTVDIGELKWPNIMGQSLPTEVRIS